MRKVRPLNGTSRFLGSTLFKQRQAFKTRRREGMRLGGAPSRDRNVIVSLLIDKVPDKVDRLGRTSLNRSVGCWYEVGANRTELVHDSCA